MTLIMMPHETRFARQAGDVQVFMHRGKVHELGNPKKLFANPGRRSWHSSSVGFIDPGHSPSIETV
ncbi:hypothetical protein JQR88_01735 [Pseudomonas luteola]